MEMQFQGKQFMLLVIGLVGLAIIAGIVIYAATSLLPGKSKKTQSTVQEEPVMQFPVDESNY